ncbi:2-oxoglutarate dehydrogenase E2 component (dihydrolipoamide succinyltransferase) [Streptomyces wuyuanensis]|uniref:Dihydrolipoamide acetyltransferase component of pyruvate dehydrogenase complex n=1 Tax=Streptomyces wuyuanensis TaxID=1196353 RepID=A0A1G9Z3E6_9ACTN|nr:2-oxo acid dehydrogenase subunit E2 [Streptomyces wuyuanensis]SDN15978.1 2-oxoglutarate dehydrogenase E2 component (dihydrolipoamide succinyltransferase) [Streptomyces wuyuanensis]
MAVSVTLPSLGESVTEGTVTRWLKQVGDTVQVDEPLLEVSTDKVDTEIPSPATGVLASITVAEEENAGIGDELAVIDDGAGAPAVEPTPSVREVATEPPAPAAEPTPTPVAALTGPVPDGNPAGDARTTPPVPTFAVPEPQPPTPADASSLRGRTVGMTRIRKVIGDSMMKALHEQAQLTTFIEVDVTRLMRLRARAKDAFAAREGIKLSPMPFFVSAAVQALKAHPVLNARINEGEGTITYFDVENVGIAVDTAKGLMTPVIKGAGDLGIAGIARRTVELADKARRGGLTPDDVAGATFTISNTGSRGALFDTVVVPPNQVAILGIGATVKKPAVVEVAGEAVIGIRDMVHLSLSYDHRLVDGADAARYLTAVRTILESAAFAGDLPLDADS